MADRKRQDDHRSTEEILREMEELSKSIDSTITGMSTEHQQEKAAQQSAPKRGGAMKSLLNFFVSVEDEGGTKAAMAPESSASPPAKASEGKGQSSGPRVSDLVAGEPHPSFAYSDQSGDLATKPFEELYVEAGLGDSTCTVDELAKLMENPAVVSQPMSIKVVAVNLALSAKGVGVDVPIADAVRRDRALDAYQAMLDERARSAEKRNTQQIEQLTREAEDYLKQKQAEMDALRAETAEAKRQSVDFALRREKEEKRLAELISPFLEGKPSPVTVGSQSDPKP